MQAQHFGSISPFFVVLLREGGRSFIVKCTMVDFPGIILFASSVLCSSKNRPKYTIFKASTVSGFSSFHSFGQSSNTRSFTSSTVTLLPNRNGCLFPETSNNTSSISSEGMMETRSAAEGGVVAPSSSSSSSSSSSPPSSLSGT